MSFKTIVTLLLMSCLSAKGTSKETLQGDVGKAAIPFTPFAIDKIRLDVTDTNATLLLCVSAGLPAGIPQLNYYRVDSPNAVTSLEGRRDVSDPTCANFMMVPPFTLPDVATRYELLLKDADTQSLGRCVSTFAMTAKTTLLTCGTEPVTKVTWGDPTPIVYSECITPDPALSAATVCYHKGEIWSEDFCFDITDQEGATIHICMNGLSSTPTVDGTVTTSYLYYGPDAISNGPGTATFPLTMGNTDLTHLRAIVRPVGAPDAGTVYDCPSNECSIGSYTRKFAHYEVCVEAMDANGDTQETATTTFTDIDLYAFDGGSQKSPLIEFVFVNWLDTKTYSASYSLAAPAGGMLGDGVSAPVNVDCTGVGDDHACFGYLDTGANVGTVYLRLLDPTGNTIVTPYAIP